MMDSDTLLFYIENNYEAEDVISILLDNYILEYSDLLDLLEDYIRDNENLFINKNEEEIEDELEA